MSGGCVRLRSSSAPCFLRLFDQKAGENTLTKGRLEILDHFTELAFGHSYIKFV